MFLLPDIYVNGSLLSTQYPFTLNGELIQNIQIHQNQNTFINNTYITNITMSNDYSIEFVSYSYRLFIDINVLKNIIKQSIFNNVAYFKEKYMRFSETEQESYDSNKYIKKLLFDNSTTPDLLFFYIFTNIKFQCRDYGNEQSNMTRLLLKQHRKMLRIGINLSYYNQTSSLIYIHNSSQIDHIRIMQMGGCYNESLSLFVINDQVNIYTFLSIMNYLGQSSNFMHTQAETNDIIDNFTNTIDHRAQTESDIFVWHDTTTQADITDTKNYIHPYNYKPEYISHYMPGEDRSTTILLGIEIEVGGTHKPQSIHNETVRKCIQIMNGSESTKENLIYSTHDGTVDIELDTMPCSIEFHKQKMNYKEMFKYLDSVGYKGHDCKTAGLHIHVNRSYLGKSSLVQEFVISKILYILEKFNDEICVIARRDNDYSKFVGDKKEEKSAVNLYGKYKNYGKKAALNLNHPDTIEFRMFQSTLKYESFILTLEFVKNVVDFAKSVQIENIEHIKWNDLMNVFSMELKNYYIFRRNKQCNDDTEKMLRKDIKNLKKQIRNCKNGFLLKSLNKDLSYKQRILKEYLDNQHKHKK